jgi:hypothetical protein
LLVVDPVIDNSRFSKVLMDGGSSLNILYAHTLWLMGIGLGQLRPSMTLFHGVAPGKRVQPLGQIDLPVWLGTPDNFRKETLTFEVVGFSGAYHAILGRPCYTKFMAVPNYTYLKMKMPGLCTQRGVRHEPREVGQRGPRLLCQARRQLRGCLANQGGAP